MSDTTPNQSDRLDEILWPAIAGSVNASINAPDGVIDTTDKSIEHFETAKAAIQAMILEAQITQTKHIRDEWGKWLNKFPGDTDEMKISDLVNHCDALVADLKTQLEQLKGAQK